MGCEEGGVREDERVRIGPVSVGITLGMDSGPKGEKE